MSGQTKKKKSKTVAELEQELAELEASNASMWNTYGSELCAGEMIEEEKALRNKIEKLKQQEANKLSFEVGKAHQRKIREEKIEEYANAKDKYWENINTDISNGIVKPITYQEAKDIIVEYEWLGCMPSISQYYFGIFFDGYCGGVTVFGTEYAENRGVWDKYNYTGRILLLARGVCVHWAHEHCGSKLIMDSIKLLPEKYDVITCTTDRAAGEIGTIYQACNFHYVGSMRKGSGHRFGVKIDGKIYGSRTIRARLGTMRKEVILEHYPDAEFVPQYNKERYFYFRGSKSNKRYLKRQIQHMIKPYPKRDEQE